MRDWAGVQGERSKPRRRGRLAVAIAAFAAVAAPAGWFGTDALEADNDFCTACHLEAGVPLHIQIRRDWDTRPAVNLASTHAAAAVRDAGAERPFRCIDCHGGVSLIGKARTKVLAAKDAFWFAVGHFDEPDGMTSPLWDEDCTQCHPDFRAAEATGDGGAPMPPFHSLPVHNANLGMACVDCHVSHGTGGSEELYYLHPERVRARCAECHTEFE